MKVFIKLLVWVSLSIILQCMGLYFLEQRVFKYTVDFETKSLELDKDKDKIEENNATIPEEAENISISYNGSYLTYSLYGKLYVEDIKNGDKKEIITEDKGDILYYKWLSDRDRIIIAEKITNNNIDVIQLSTYNAKDRSQIVVRTICNYEKNMQVNKISASVLTGVYYIDVYKGGKKSVVYRVDRNDRLTKLTLRANILGNMEVIPREDRLIYEDEITNEFYITNPESRLEFNSNRNLALLGINQEGIVFVGELDGEKVSSIIYGKLSEKTSNWKKIELESVVKRDEIYFNEKNEILVNDNLQGKIKNLMTNAEIEYDGNLIEIKEDFIATISNSGELKYINLEETE